MFDTWSVFSYNKGTKRKGDNIMDMQGLVNLIVNSSVSIVVIAYFMFRDYKFMQQLSTSIQQFVDKLDIIIKFEDEKQE